MSKRRKRGPSTKEIFLDALGGVLCVIFSLLLICNLTIIIKGTLNPKAPPSVLGITPMSVLSGSMSGTQEGHIEVGDLIFIRETEPEKLQVGDVISFIEGSIVVTHRIMEVQTAEDGSRQWITKGDANNAEDIKPVSEDQLIGIFAARIPKIGDVAMFMQKPAGMLLVIGIPLLGFVIYDVIRRKRIANQEKAKNDQMLAELQRLRALAGETQNGSRRRENH